VLGATQFVQAPKRPAVGDARQPVADQCGVHEQAVVTEDIRHACAGGRLNIALRLEANPAPQDERLEAPSGVPRHAWLHSGARGSEAEQMHVTAARDESAPVDDGGDSHG
jgi:hypothetical protein